MVMSPCLSSSSWLTPLTKPSCWRISATRSFSFECGMMTFAFRAVMALRMRVRRSAIGSVILSPARFDDARNVAAQRQLPEAQAAQFEFANESTRAPALGAAVAQLHLVLLLARRELFQRKRLCQTRHVYKLLNGIPSARSSARP